MDFSVAVASGLSQTELAKVLGVSRVTVNLWMNGKMKPHRYHADTIEQKLALLDKAVKANLIPKRTARVQRHDAVVEILKSLA